ncbi:hypothetical protein GCM10027290_38900 [Micromonospora sonneratiae]
MVMNATGCVVGIREYQAALGPSGTVTGCGAGGAGNRGSRAAYLPVGWVGVGVAAVGSGLPLAPDWAGAEGTARAMIRSTGAHGTPETTTTATSTATTTGAIRTYQRLRSRRHKPCSDPASLSRD